MFKRSKTTAQFISLSCTQKIVMQKIKYKVNGPPRARCCGSVQLAGDVNHLVDHVGRGRQALLWVLEGPVSLESQQSLGAQKQSLLLVR